MADARNVAIREIFADSKILRALRRFRKLDDLNLEVAMELVKRAAHSS